jgi:hypothetical protein
MSESPTQEIAKLRVRIRNLSEAQETTILKLEQCLVKWEELSVELQKSPGSVDRTIILKLHLEAHKALLQAFESQSREEHERSHIPESLGSLLLGVENLLQTQI